MTSLCLTPPRPRRTHAPRRELGELAPTRRDHSHLPSHPTPPHGPPPRPTLPGTRELSPLAQNAEARPRRVELHLGQGLQDLGVVQDPVQGPLCLYPRKAAKNLQRSEKGKPSAEKQRNNNTLCTRNGQTSEFHRLFSLPYKHPCLLLLPFVRSTALRSTDGRIGGSEERLVDLQLEDRGQGDAPHDVGLLLEGRHHQVRAPAEGRSRHFEAEGEKSKNCFFLRRLVVVFLENFVLVWFLLVCLRP